MALDAPTRSFHEGTALERAIGFLAASVFSCVYVVAPLYVLLALAALAYAPLSTNTWLLLAPLALSLALPPDLATRYGPYVLSSYACRQIPKYFHYEEYHETSEEELLRSGRNFILASHPHGVFSFVGVCAAVASVNAPDGLGPNMARIAPTAAASVIKRFPLLKDVLGVFGVIDASGKTLAKQLARPASSVVIYVGGMAELFRSSPKREAVFLKKRKGFIKMGLRTGADVIPLYLFGNTTVLSTLNTGPLATLSRKLGVSVTFFWGRWGLPVPKPVRLVYARGRPLGMPHIPEPTDADVDHWHAEYCRKLQELFENYKGRNPDYKHKELVIE
ncbi:hypothetical protein AB1Y20_002910 [Prymnesium parvum]|uniref:Acyltransferase n=1 Tax=Prymnesium parvum TaxID=97485 RepID=A0AB34JBY2_PRYPA